jgi:hypothetical protein
MDRTNRRADGGTSVRETGTTGVDSTERTVDTAAQTTTRTRTDRWLAAGLVALAAALALNTLAGPLAADLVSYPFSQTLVYQTVGLEAVTLAVVVPWCLAAAALVRRGHRAGPVLAVAPTAYTAYMFVQYVVGPSYLTYRPVVAAHLGIFVLGGALLAVAYNRIRLDALPVPSERRDRRTAVGIGLLAAFVVFRYVPSFGGMVAGDPLTAEFAADPAMFWSIFLLDLGIVVPVTVAAALGLRRGAAWARKATLGVVGWYVPVPVSVAAMGLVMLVNDDPNTSLGFVVTLGIAAVLFTGFAVWVYRPLFRASDGDGA